jgi:sulfite exporter TauE/SafE
MILAGLNLLGKFRLPAFLEVDLSKMSVYQSSFRLLLHSQKWSSFYLLGMLNGLIPCGFVYFFAVKAASTASPLWGGVVMVVFGLATIPALLTLGFLVSRFNSLHTKCRDIIYKIAGFAVVGYGGYTLTIAYRFLTDPSASLLHCH